MIVGLDPVRALPDVLDYATSVARALGADVQNTT